MALNRVVRRLPDEGVRRKLLVLLMVLAALSTAVGVNNALHRSQDFQWSGEHVLLQHVDPWAEYLRGDPQHRFVETQIPNYLAILYVLLVPLGLLPMLAAKAVWAVCNVACAVGSAVLAARFYGLTGRDWSLVVACLMLMATATRNTIGNGQQGLLVLLIWCVSLLACEVNTVQAGVAGISFFKFSFAPPIVIYLWLRWGWRKMLCSGVPAFASVALVWLWLTGGHQPARILTLMLEPFQVAQTGFKADAGDPNLMNLVHPAFAAASTRLATGLELTLALGMSATISYFALVRHKEGAKGWQMALMATVSYSLFKHHAYDAVVLLLPLCFALARRREARARAVLAVLSYLFYGQRLVEALHLHRSWMRWPEFVLLVGVMILTYQMRLPQDGGREVQARTGAAQSEQIAA
jgi:hypothetical protein